ncbi:MULTISPECIES: flagellar hook-associated protein FlgL [Enterobacter]|uniref:Flagellar hook-associated protein FlgL n=1 Tax=Enterobacter rongchengensis TaxID=3030999 RepID=A0ABV4J9U0_9ENTR|nr:MULTISPECIES: flagellar hook-associated protein FlgL [Enterobacter]PNL53496.1 flagellar hook-associated protein 3 [Enterobacter hormaechei]HCR0840651.1 flagellar hook-associated protein FlgL [Enterobacter cancerogenus]EKX4010876.1 flagellar hook-associated protein FlgL [Enterobacter cloacae]ELV3045452.1 flagellar hook-associated protein FlgL [Enterobacter chengduensis]MCK7282938.1 flagellar hook-associated protein FlgL [Enterobacter chengduensis]
MRISSLYNSDAMLAQLGVNGTRMSKLMEQMSTQKRINVPSDDPVAATRLVQLNREQAAIKQYQNNITGLSGALSTQEAHVTAMSNQLLSLNDKLLAAANGTHSTADMAGFGAELSTMLDSLVASINAQNESGGYLFSGTKTDTKPVVWDEAQGKYIYLGNSGSRETTVANGVNVTENTHVVGAFSGSGDDLEMLNKLKALSDKMQDPDIPVSDYQDDINEMIELSGNARDKVAAIFTDLGGRQNRLTMLSDAHADVSMANDQVVRDLSDTDWATTSINLQLFTNSVQITNKAYSMISQLSLFSMM